MISKKDKEEQKAQSFAFFAPLCLFCLSCLSPSNRCCCALITMLDDWAEPTTLETALMSQPALAVEWDTSEEDAAWAHLAQVPAL